MGSFLNSMAHLNGQNAASFNYGMQSLQDTIKQELIDLPNTLDPNVLNQQQVKDWYLYGLMCYWLYLTRSSACDLAEIGLKMFLILSYANKKIKKISNKCPQKIMFSYFSPFQPQLYI